MKATIGKKQKYITIKPTPEKDVLNGLLIYLSSDYKREEWELPIATTNIIKGKSRYYLPTKCVLKVIKIETQVI